MPEWLVALITPLFSVGGVALISKVSLSIIKSIPKKTDNKTKELESQNALLRQQNEELKQFIKGQEKKVDMLLEMTKNEHEARVNEHDKVNSILEKSSDLINVCTTIKNQARTILDSKKEE